MLDPYCAVSVQLDTLLYPNVIEHISIEDGSIIVQFVLRPIARSDMEFRASLREGYTKKSVTAHVRRMWAHLLQQRAQEIRDLVAPDAGQLNFVYIAPPPPVNPETINTTPVVQRVL